MHKKKVNELYNKHHLNNMNFDMSVKNIKKHTI